MSFYYIDVETVRKYKIKEKNPKSAVDFFLHRYINNKKVHLISFCYIGTAKKYTSTAYKFLLHK